MNEKRIGRPPGSPSVGDGVMRHSVTLDAKTVSSARQIGFGNLSLGLRIAVDAYLAHLARENLARETETDAERGLDWPLF